MAKPRPRTLWTLAPLALAALALPLLAAPQDAKDKEIADLRVRLVRSEDSMLRMARGFDIEKKRLMDEKEKLLKEMATITKNAALAGAGGAGAKPAKTYDYNLHGPRSLTLTRVLKELKPLKLKFKLDGLSGKERVMLRLQQMNEKQLLDAVSLNVRPAKGTKGKGWVPVTWAKVDGTVTFKRK